MALKTRLNEDERYGLSNEEIKLAEKYLRKHKTAGALKELEAAKLFELYLLGETFAKIAHQFPQYPMPQIILTAALRGWAKDRDKTMHTLQDRVRAKVVKSVLDQVDFLTAMMSVANVEHLEAMTKYVLDPINNPKPDMRISNIKEYKEVAETLYKIVSGATAGASGGKNNNQKVSPMFEALTATTQQKQIQANQQQEPDDISIMDAVLE